MFSAGVYPQLEILSMEVSFVSNAVAAPACAICGQPVSLETGKADEDGRIVHEQCYVAKLRERPLESKGGHSRKFSGRSVDS
jgi:hypothetical protein